MLDHGPYLTPIEKPSSAPGLQINGVALDGLMANFLGDARVGRQVEHVLVLDKLSLVVCGVCVSVERKDQLGEVHVECSTDLFVWSLKRCVVLAQGKFHKGRISTLQRSQNQDCVVSVS